MPVVADRIVEASEGLIVFQSSVIGEGHSGGALLTGRGEIVGLIQAHEPPFGRARPIATLFDTLQSWGYHVAAHWPEAVHRAAEDGDLGELRRLLIAGGCAVLQELDASGWTPLQLAAARGRPAVVALLLEHGADIARRNQREPALFRAAAANDAEIVALLLQAGADVNQPDGGGTTPLFAAVIARSAEMVRRLLAARADVNHANSDGETPLTFAVRRSDVPITRLLLAAGADVNVRSRWDVSVLSLVEERRTGEQKELYKLLVDKGAVR